MIRNPSKIKFETKSDRIWWMIYLVKGTDQEDIYSIWGKRSISSEILFILILSNVELLFFALKIVISHSSNSLKKIFFLRGKNN